MDREKEIKERLSAVMEQRFEENAKRMEKYYHVHKKETDQDFYERITLLFDRVLEMQGRNTEKQAGYLRLASLQSGAVTKTCEYQLAVYDQNGYLDKEPCFVYWHPAHILRNVAGDLESFTQLIKKQMIRVRGYETDPIYSSYIRRHDQLAEDYFQAMVPEIVTMEKFREIRQADGFEIRSGAYGEVGRLLYKNRPE